MAKRRRKTRQVPSHSCPCYWHPPRCSWLRWLWCGAGCHQWPSGILAAQCKAASPGGSVGRSPLLLCHSRGSPSVQQSKIEREREIYLVCLDKNVAYCCQHSAVDPVVRKVKCFIEHRHKSKNRWRQRETEGAIPTVVAQLSGRQWWECSPPIILIAWPSEHHRATLYAHHVLRESSFAVLQKWMTQRHSMKIESVRKVDALREQT